MFNDIFGIYTSWFHKDTVSKCKLDPSHPSIFLVFFLFFVFLFFHYYGLSVMVFMLYSILWLSL